MSKALSRTVVMVAAVGFLAQLAGCGAPTEPGRLAEPTATTSKTVRKIAVLAPLTGTQAIQGRGLLRAVESAVEQRQADLEKSGIELIVMPLDDRGESSVGQQQATRLPDDAAVVGLIGSVNSLVNESVQPIVNNAGIAMVAPGGGATTLTTRGQPVRRAFRTFFRLCALDVNQGTATSRWVGRGKATSVVLITDGQLENRLVGRSLAQGLGKGVRLTTLTVARASQTPPPAAVLARIRQAKPARIVFYGNPDDALALRASLKLPRVPFLTAGSIALDEAAQSDPAAWAGVQFSTVGAVPQSLPGFRPSVAPSPTAGSAEVSPPGLYAAAGTDAANLMINQLLSDRIYVSTSATSGQRRKAMVTAISKANAVGLTGRIRFNAFGQVLQAPIGFGTFTRLDEPAWQPAIIVSTQP